MPEVSFHQRLFLGLSIIVVIAYAWLTARLLEPKFVFPKRVLSEVYWIEDGKWDRLENVLRRKPVETAKVVAAVATLGTPMSVIGELKSPVPLLIFNQDPFRSVVTDQRIELGIEVANSSGQVLKAVMKSWLLQKARPEITASLLRLETASDVLAAVAQGSFSLSAKHDGKQVSLEPSRIHSWARFAASKDVYCDSPWRSFEVRAFCEAKGQEALGVSSETIIPLAFRSLLSSFSWEIYGSLSVFEKLDFAKEWTAYLTADKTAITPPDELPERIGDWRSWLAAEIEAIMPARIFAGRGHAQDYAELLKKAGLGVSQSIGVDLVLLLDDPKTSTSTAGLTERRAPMRALWGIASRDDSSMLLMPGRVRVQEDELAVIKTNLLVWEACGTPRVRDLTKAKIAARRFLMLGTCGGVAPSDYATLLQSGLDDFIISRSDLPFVLIKREPIDLALSLGVLQASSPLSDLMKGKNSGGARLLGLDNPKFEKKTRSYRVLGAIEAVERFRTSESPSRAIHQ